MFFWLLVIFIIMQRLAEFVIAKRNEKQMLAKGAVEFDRAGYKYIVLMHTMFFISLIAEYELFDRQLFEYWYIPFIIFLLAQFLRYWAITSLGEFWNTRIIILPGAELITKGPYRYLSHPNYIAVCAELAFIPLIFSCYYTAVFFTAANFIVLKRRIKIEERALIKR